jgi:hypothetical protein
VKRLVVALVFAIGLEGACADGALPPPRSPNDPSNPNAAEAPLPAPAPQPQLEGPGTFDGGRNDR